MLASLLAPLPSPRPLGHTLAGCVIALVLASASAAHAGDVSLSFSKSFTDDPVAPGDTVTLELTLTNLAGLTVTNLTFTDDLDAALPGLVAVGLPANDVCGAGSTASGTSLVTLTGGSLAPGASCTLTLTLQVPAGAAPGTVATNVTSLVTGTLDGSEVTGGPATDDLQIQVLDFAKAFDGPSVAGGTPTLTFTLTNLDADGGLGGLAFTDDLDAVMPGLVALGLPVNDVCGAGSLVSGTALLTVSGATLAPGGSCSFDVILQVPAAAAPGSYVNTTSDLTTTELPVAVAAPATATLAIEPPPAFAKSFAPDVIAAGDEVSTLTFTIDNSASALAASGLAFTDNLPAGVVVANPPNASTTCTGGTLTATAASGVVSYTGGTVAAGATCTVQVDVTSETALLGVNTTGDLTSSSGNSGTATDTLEVEGPCGNGRLNAGELCDGEVFAEGFDVCPTGYEGEPVCNEGCQLDDPPEGCTDVDECDDGADNCDEVAACTNEPAGSFTCTCPEGYDDTNDDGTLCTEVDECADETDDCDELAACTNEPAGSFTCTCPEGYVDSNEDGTLCTDVDECDLGIGECVPNARCVNQPGDYTCECLSGYAGDPDEACLDVDECADALDNCHAFAACTNEEGGFTCACLAGFTGDGVEACDAVCGDGLVVEGEPCDDGNDLALDGCFDCAVEDGWVCADGDLRSACEPEECGDGVLAEGGEGCEDGNADDGDGCSADCALEAGFDCTLDEDTGVIDECGAVCGDGLLRGDEACDDDNDGDDDGCTACAVDDGFVCNGEPSVCSVDCGDGVVGGGERCDDGNDAAGDGCTRCAVDSGFLCDDGEPTVCVRDSDGDELADDIDNCPLVANEDQLDEDADDVGDACDDDVDGDGVDNLDDNCPGVSNADQTDTDDDGIGDTCDDDSDGDGLDNDREGELGTDPLDPDSDDDGLNDGDEVDVYGTDPLDRDTDDGGVPDGEEVAFGTDPLDPNDDFALSGGSACSGSVVGREAPAAGWWIVGLAGVGACAWWRRRRRT